MGRKQWRQPYRGMKIDHFANWPRAIYVGPTFCHSRGSLSYGRTGRHSPPFTPSHFLPDGQPLPVKVSPTEVYVPSKNRTAYYPKPS